MAAILGTMPGDHLVFRNLYLPVGGGRTIEVDAVVITKSRVYMVEVKNWTGGKIRGSARLRDWSVKYGDAKPVKRYSPVKQSLVHAKVLTRYLRLSNPDLCHSLIVFPASATFVSIPKNTREFTILKTPQLRPFLTRRQKTRKDCFAPSDIRTMAKSLKAASKASTATKRSHIAQAQQAQSTRLLAKQKRQRS